MRSISSGLPSSRARVHVRVLYRDCEGKRTTSRRGRHLRQADRSHGGHKVDSIPVSLGRAAPSVKSTTCAFFFCLASNIPFGAVMTRRLGSRSRETDIFGDARYGCLGAQISRARISASITPEIRRKTHQSLITRSRVPPGAAGCDEIWIRTVLAIGSRLRTGD